jgi:membrane-bound lytic murein transglycosylase B
MISRRLVVVAGGLLALGAPVAKAIDGDFSLWLQGVRQDALAQGIASATLDRALADVAPIPHIIELDRHQPESTITFAEYIARIVTPQRREDGRARLNENRALLDDIAQRYGVAPRFITALWGIETDFGRVTGDYQVIPALATLAFDGRRPAFFRHELINALLIVDREHIDPHRMLGSWAGAMGQSQFMPSSFLTYAVSYRGNSAPDIWTRRDDVFASIANYLAEVGWRRDEGWGDPVTLPAGFDAASAPQDSRRTPAQWEALGVRRVDGKPLAATAGQASLILPAGPDGAAFLGYDNYRALLKWNNSSYFAIAVGYLADDFEGR